MVSLRYLALGDSYTIGESVEAEDRWPELLKRSLNDLGMPVSKPVIIARTGWTTDELAEGIRNAGVRGPFDLVTLLIGVNNQYRGRPPGEYRGQFSALLDSSIDFAGGNARKVVVVSIPDWGITPFAADRDQPAIAREIDVFNAINRDLSATRGAQYVDVTACSRLAASDSKLTAPDGLHPSAAMYQMWTELILPHAEAALSG